MGVKKYALPILRSYSAVLFNSSTKGGALLLLLTFLNPNLGIGGFTAVVSAYAFAKLVGFKDEFLRLDYYIYNPLLVGLSLGYLFKVNLLSLFFFSIAGVLTFLLTYTLSSLFSYYLKLPVLSVPFVVASSLLYLASSKFSNLFVGSLYPHSFFFPLELPGILAGYLKSLGAIFFMPNVFAGAVIFLLLLFISRILTFLSVLGYLCGIFTKALFVGSFYSAVSDTSSFNYILTSMAVGGVFLIPSIRSYKFAILSAVLSVPVVEGAKVFWESYGLPVFALPFNVTTHLLLYVLLSVSYFYVTKIYKGTPERTLDYYLTVSKRFPFTGREVALPFSGEWTVWQSFDGEWTHKGSWKYAVDFVITDEEGKTYKNQGIYLTDYYAFGKPVLSPVEGQVVAVVNSLPDNPPGQADKENNWGNYVVIYDKRGFYVLLAHFKQNSIKVKVGDYVVKGALLGLCGNSGYSPQPHIHIHVQALPEPGSPTLPFSFSSYISNGVFKDTGVPKVGEKLEPVFPDKGLRNRLNLLIDQRMEFVVRENSERKEFSVTVKMAPDGTFYLTDGASKLYFGIKNSTFYFYHFEGNLNSPLKYFFFAAPKIPLISGKIMRWEDYLPLMTLSSELRRELYLFLSSFKHSLFEVKVESRFSSENKVESDIFLPEGRLSAALEISEDFGFEKVTFGENVTIERRRGDEETAFSV
ncbi:urea transporter [Phorcysia thermohydrogeniphila]|uniref:Urea transporter n=1 Tax=Phorcysia thermohydrogeniphila TaxID=936138 RepID=A0A4R1GH44_9BACT|nr:urea transporter [Phorcysia thermohydrogeniphila]TCK06323.1 urea transporter [Phorcysia thermohydrogeniphila]